MHTLKPKHSKLNEKETEEFLLKLNISKAQLPKILSTDTALPEDCIVGDIIKIERRELKGSASDKNQPKDDEKTNIYFRVVV